MPEAKKYIVKTAATPYGHAVFITTPAFDLPKCFVDRPEPTHIGAGGEHDEPDDGQTKVSYSSAPKHPSKAAEEIHGKCCTVYCKNKTHVNANALERISIRCKRNDRQPKLKNVNKKSLSLRGSF